MGTCSTSSVTREVQIKTTTRHHFASTGMAAIENKEQQVLGRMRRNCYSHTFWEGI